MEWEKSSGTSRAAVEKPEGVSGKGPSKACLEENSRPRLTKQKTDYAKLKQDKY